MTKANKHKEKGKKHTKTKNLSKKSLVVNLLCKFHKTKYSTAKKKVVCTEIRIVFLYDKICFYCDNKNY